MLKDAGCKALVTQERLKSVFAGFVGETICVDSDWPLIARESSQNPGQRAMTQNLAYIIYTSGSTGDLKE